MIFSRTWLQSYTKTTLPEIKELSEALMLHAFEIEEIIDDDLVDVDVLPNRAHDCLCHRGMAYELASILSFDIDAERYPELSQQNSTDAPIIHVENTDHCRRYSAFTMTNVEVKESPDWITSSLEAIGQKTINNIVDATNYVMFDLGQPLHAFDADKVVGDIKVRNAHEGEAMTTLTGEVLELSSLDLVIADDEGVLALAGVKGGTKAEVDSNTKNIIVELANFDPVSTRATTRRHKLHTDSSKRFENEIHPKLIDEVYPCIKVLLLELASTEDSQTSGLVTKESYPDTSYEIEVRLSEIQGLLGLDISREEVEDILKRAQMSYVVDAEVFTVTTNYRRFDLRIKEDIIEEIGRLYGYHMIPSKSVSDIDFKAKIHGPSYVRNVITNLLVSEGFSELFTYTFVELGERVLANPIAQDKKALRTSLEHGLSQAVELNAKKASFYGVNQIKVFEIGVVHTNGNEELRCALAISNLDKKAKKQYGSEEDQLKEVTAMISEKIQCDIDLSFGEGIVSFKVPELKEEISRYEDIFDHESYTNEMSFHPISAYPHSTRDISFWADERVSQEQAQKVIKEAVNELVVKIFLFDEFHKEGRVSYAYSLVFQSQEKTLTDTEIDEVMTKLYQVLEKNGCEIR